MKKDIIRKKALELRNNLDPDYVKRNSSVIAGRVFQLEQWQKSRLTMVYMSFAQEVSTGDLIENLLLKKKEFAIPVIEGRRLIPYKAENLKENLEPSKFGVLELKRELRTLQRRIDKDKINLIIMPGVAFDREKNRIGFGAGYYDRFLAGLKPGVIKIALAFEVQIFDHIPTLSHDIPVDMIITEKRVIL